MLSTNNLVKIFTFTCLLITMGSLQPTNASIIGKPVIAMSKISCGGFYLLEIFENGDVEFRSTGRKKLGVYKSQISQKKLDALIKEFIEADFIDADNLKPDLSLSNNVIRFWQSERVARVFFQADYARPIIINKLANDIIQTTKISQWPPAFKNCAGSDLAVMFEQLKLK